MFPTVQLITLEETPEREAHAIFELNKVGLFYQVNRFQRIVPEWKRRLNSHLQVYRRHRNDEIIFICEDNIMAQKPPLSQYENLLKFLSKCRDWGIIYLGGYIARPWDYCQETIFPQVYETKRNNHGVSSYIIHSRVFRNIIKLHDLSPIEEPIDCFLSRFKTYVYNPFLFYSGNQPDGTPFSKIWNHPQMMRVHTLIFFNKIWLYIFSIIILGGLWCFMKRKRKNSSQSSGGISNGPTGGPGTSTSGE